jgi:polyhydroxyalkanoate synthesis regulator phasin
MQNEQIKDQASNALVKKIKKEYYMYSESGFGASKVSNYSSSIQGLKIAKDTIVRVTSGLLNENNSVVLSHLHKSIKSLNQLRILEDATIIYTMTRAPERRIFYVDVGNLPKAKAEQYLHDMMARHKNRVTYDPSSGEIKDDRKMMTMTEDYWFPRREGNNATEVTTLNGGSGLGEDKNLPYFQSKLYKSLNVPVARLQPETMYSFGRMSEVTREELKFAKFIKRLRTRFSILFDRCLERQLVLKGVISPDEWKEIQNKIRYDFMKDNYFEELKEAEILREKLETLRQIEEQIGKYFSREWVVKNVLYMPEDEWKDMKKQIDKEAKEEPPIDDIPQDSQGAAPPQPPQDDQPTEEGLTVINRKNLTNFSKRAQK